VSQKQIVAYWLVPAEPARSFFSSLVGDLAARFEAPVFEPHVTVYATTGEQPEAAEILRRAFAREAPLRLTIRAIKYSEKFTQTLFVQFEDDKRLTAVSELLRRASGQTERYELTPHLSLIYQTMDSSVKSEVAEWIRLPFTEVTFDLARAIVTPSRIKSRADVEAWRVVATQGLDVA